MPEDWLELNVSTGQKDRPGSVLRFAPKLIITVRLKGAKHGPPGPAQAGKSVNRLSPILLCWKNIRQPPGIELQRGLHRSARPAAIHAQQFMNTVLITESGQLTLVAARVAA